MWTNDAGTGSKLPVALSRRQMLQRMCAGFGMVGLAGMLPRIAAASSASPLAHFAPRAKRVIFMFMSGGHLQVETFDAKAGRVQFEGKQPEGKKTKGSGYMPSPLKFNRCGRNGIEISETLPNIGSIIDDICVVRSMHTDVPNHEAAMLKMHTGNLQPVRPSLGSWVLYGLGSENENLPGYVVLRPTPKIVVGPALWSNSFLPAQYQAASVITSDMAVEKLVTNIHNPYLSRPQQRKQLDLLEKMNQLHLRHRDGDMELEGQIKTMETAFAMQSEAMKTFDISREDQKTREMYGNTPFQRSCLLARRLVEDGVRFVTVYYTSQDNQPWDTHTDHDERHRKLCADADRATAALIKDLKARGMLDETLVVWGGEFGRTPYAQNDGKSKVGRDHHHTGFSMLMAGGGVQGGVAYGATDELGMHAVQNPGHVNDRHATILHLLGLNHEKLPDRYAARDFRLTDVYGQVVKGVIA